MLFRSVGDNPAAAVKAWHTQLCGTDWFSRSAFFEDVRKEYDKVSHISLHQISVLIWDSCGKNLQDICISCLEFYTTYITDFQGSSTDLDVKYSDFVTQVFVVKLSYSTL